MEDELKKPIQELCLTHLWVRLVLGQKMLSAGLKVPDWLKQTFAPDRMKLIGPIVFPKSQKLQSTHPFFENFISTLAAHDEWKRGLKSSKKTGSREGLVALFFHSEVAPRISDAFGNARKQGTLKIAYHLLRVSHFVVFTKKFDIWS